MSNMSIKTVLDVTQEELNAFTGVVSVKDGIFDPIETMKRLRVKYQISLTDAHCITNFLCGLPNEGDIMDSDEVYLNQGEDLVYKLIAANR